MGWTRQIFSGTIDKTTAAAGAAEEAHDAGQVVLIGMPGSGKSTVGLLLAKSLGFEFIDLDLVISRQNNGLPLQAILEGYGFAIFSSGRTGRPSPSTVISRWFPTGGSVVLSPAAMRHLKELGTLVFLDVPLPELARRIRNITTRGIAFDRGQTLTDVYHQRLPLYQRWAEVTVPVAPGEDVNHLAARLLAELGRLGPDAPREKPAL